MHNLQGPAVELPSSPLGEADPALEALALETGRLAFQLARTSVREKLLQNIAQDAVRSQLGLAFRLHVTAAQMHDVPTAHLFALLRFVAPLTGYPAAAEAVGALADLIGADRGAADLAADELDAPGSERSVPRALLADTADQWLSAFMVSRLKHAWSENALSQREKIIVAITVAVVGAAEEHTLTACVQAGLEVGVPSAAMMDAVRYCAELRPDRTPAALRLTCGLLDPQRSIPGATASVAR